MSTCKRNVNKVSVNIYDTLRERKKFVLTFPWRRNIFEPQNTKAFDQENYHSKESEKNFKNNYHGKTTFEKSLKTDSKRSKLEQIISISLLNGVI